MHPAKLLQSVQSDELEHRLSDSDEKTGIAVSDRLQSISRKEGQSSPNPRYDMRKTRSSKLNLLALENRLAPAVTATLTSGNLAVSGDTASHTILVSGSTGSVK